MLDPVKLAEYLGVTQDARVDDAAAAATSWVEGRRSVTDPVALWAGEDVTYGALLFGALLYQARVTPSGLPGYSDDPALFAQTTDALYRARELVGNDPVIA